MAIGWGAPSRPLHRRDQQTDRSEDSRHGNPSGKCQQCRRRGVAHQQPHRDAPPLGQKVGDVQFGHDLPDLPPLKCQQRKHTQGRSARHLNRVGRGGPCREGGDVAAHGRASRIGCRQNTALRIRHRSQQQALPVAGGSRAVQNVVNLPYILAQHERAKRHRQPFDVQARSLAQAGVLHRAEDGQNPWLATSPRATISPAATNGTRAVTGRLRNQSTITGQAPGCPCARRFRRKGPAAAVLPHRGAEAAALPDPRSRRQAAAMHVGRR